MGETQNQAVDMMSIYLDRQARVRACKSSDDVEVAVSHALPAAEQRDVVGKTKKSLPQNMMSTVQGCEKEERERGKKVHAQSFQFHTMGKGIGAR